MTGEPLDAWHSGTGKVLRVGDVVKLDSKAHRWRIRQIVKRPSGSIDVYVAGWGPTMKARDSGVRIFVPERLTTDRAATARALAVDARVAGSAAIEAKRTRRAS